MKARFLAVAAAVFALFSAQGHAQQLTNAGTLRCTIAPGSFNTAGEARELSCVFKPLAGIEANYAGTITRVDDPAPTADQLFLVWSVLATNPQLPIQSLQGKYVGKVGGDADPTEPAGGLIADDGSIELRPLTRLPDSRDNGAFLVLTLDLKSTRA